MRPYLLALLILAGCATQKQDITTTWAPTNEQWEKFRQTGVNLNKPDGKYVHMPKMLVNNILTVRAKLEATSGVTADLVVVESEKPNAFATIYKGRPIIAFSTSYLNYLGYDVDALATTYGHELAHLKLGHSGQARKEREETAQGVGIVAGTIAGAFIPFGGTITSLAATSVARSFTRDEERAADEHGLKWAVEAGYDPCGKARVVEHFARYSSGGIPLLSTHPSYSERSALADEYAKKATGKGC